MNPQWQALTIEAAALDGITNAPGVPSALTQVAPPQPADTKKELAAILGPMFQIIAPGWQVTPDEVDALAECYADVLNKYFPGGVSLGVEINALLCTAMIFGPRWGSPRKIKKQPTQAQPTPPPTTPGQQDKPAAQPQSTRG